MNYKLIFLLKKTKDYKVYLKTWTFARDPYGQVFDVNELIGENLFIGGGNEAR